MTTTYAALASGASAPGVHWTINYPTEERSGRSWNASWWGAEEFWYLNGSGGDTWRVGQ